MLCVFCCCMYGISIMIIQSPYQKWESTFPKASINNSFKGSLIFILGSFQYSHVLENRLCYVCIYCRCGWFSSCARLHRGVVVCVALCLCVCVASYIRMYLCWGETRTIGLHNVQTHKRMLKPRHIRPIHTAMHAAVRLQCTWKVLNCMHCVRAAALCVLNVCV